MPRSKDPVAVPDQLRMGCLISGDQPLTGGVGFLSPTGWKHRRRLQEASGLRHKERCPEVLARLSLWTEIGARA